MPLTLDEKQRLIAKLQSHGWTLRGNTIYPPSGTDWLSFDRSGMGGIYALADLRQIETARLCTACGVREVQSEMTPLPPRDPVTDIATLAGCLDELWREVTTDFRQATQNYETWLRKIVPLVDEDLTLKHEQMRQGMFPFLLATYYRWVQRWPEVFPDALGPEVNCVGDLHVENFCTWRDVEGRLVWGIHDFDEAHPMPYTSDLVRLATSACIAVRAGKLLIAESDACDAILEGYRNTLAQDGCPLVLAGRNRELRQMVEACTTRLYSGTKSSGFQRYPSSLPNMPRLSSSGGCRNRVWRIASFTVLEMSGA